MRWKECNWKLQHNYCLPHRRASENCMCRKGYQLGVTTYEFYYFKYATLYPKHTHVCVSAYTSRYVCIWKKYTHTHPKKERKEQTNKPSNLSKIFLKFWRNVQKNAASKKLLKLSYAFSKQRGREIQKQEWSNEDMINSSHHQVSLEK